MSTDTPFTDLGVPRSLVEILAKLGITTPTPIQAATLPDSFAGRDVLGRGRTGSGKTYAFLLPLVTRLASSGLPRKAGRPRALILAPTRELVGQIEQVLAPLAAANGLTTRTVFGGVGQHPQAIHEPDVGRERVAPVPLVPRSGVARVERRRRHGTAEDPAAQR